mmetsp:Transcript_3845/g.9635  ORF Transcript_3845/g.9635 Transcript_3845/m.9635 type:complete len:270 (+) Transcript_3845:612-1421(+)
MAVSVPIPPAVVPMRRRKVESSSGRYLRTTLRTVESSTPNRCATAAVALSTSLFGVLASPGSELLMVSVRWLSVLSSKGRSRAMTSNTPRCASSYSGPLSINSATVAWKWCVASIRTDSSAWWVTSRALTFRTSSNIVVTSLRADSTLSWVQRACRMAPRVSMAAFAAPSSLSCMPSIRCCTRGATHSRGTERTRMSDICSTGLDTTEGGGWGLLPSGGDVIVTGSVSTPRSPNDTEGEACPCSSAGGGSGEASLSRSLCCSSPAAAAP